MPLPEGSEVAVSVDYVGPLSVTSRGNTYILLFNDRFSRRADMFPVTAAEFTAEGTANILVNQYIPLMGVPAHHALGHWTGVLLQAFASCISAVGRAQPCYNLLSSDL